MIEGANCGLHVELTAGEINAGTFTLHQAVAQQGD